MISTNTSSFPILQNGTSSSVNTCNHTKNGTINGKSKHNNRNNASGAIIGSALSTKENREKNHHHLDDVFNENEDRKVLSRNKKDKEREYHQHHNGKDKSEKAGYQQQQQKLKSIDQSPESIAVTPELIRDSNSYERSSCENSSSNRMSSSYNGHSNGRHHYVQTTRLDQMGMRLPLTPNGKIVFQWTSFIYFCDHDSV